jgi:hypothetical protein
MFLYEVIVGAESFSSLSREKSARFLRTTAAALKSPRMLTIALKNDQGRLVRGPKSQA